MTRWEYATFKFQAEGFWQGGRINEENLEAKLNDFGAEGWELVTIASATTSANYTKDIVAVFKRPKKG